LYPLKEGRYKMKNDSTSSRRRLNKKIGKRISRIRRERGMTQEILLDCLYCDLNLFLDRNTLSLIERGQIVTSWYNLFAICYELDITMEELCV
jgi:transcriptional regulator with XRE-family HTH domain